MPNFLEASTPFSVNLLCQISFRITLIWRYLNSSNAATVFYESVTQTAKKQYDGSFWYLISMSGETLLIADPNQYANLIYPHAESSQESHAEEKVPEQGS
jgi:hypothetical protein